MTIPFHNGEITVQTRAGVREEAEQIGKVISGIIKPAAAGSDSEVVIRFNALLAGGYSRG